MKIKITLLLFAAIFAVSLRGHAQITATLTVSPGTTVCDTMPVTFTVNVVGCTLAYKVNWIINGLIHDSCNSCTSWTTTLSTNDTMVWCYVNCNPMGNDNSNAIDMTITPCAGIEEYENGSMVSLYPNPASGNIVIDVERLRMFPAALFVYDNRGKSLNVNYEIKNRSAILSAKQFEDGIYYYRIADNDRKKSAAGKFVILQ